MFSHPIRAGRAVAGDFESFQALASEVAYVGAPVAGPECLLEGAVGRDLTRQGAGHLGWVRFSPFKTLYVTLGI